jgi:hypothetical protein
MFSTQITQNWNSMMRITDYLVYKDYGTEWFGILGPVHDNEKENWRILTNKEIYVIVKNSTEQKQ